MPTNSGLEEVHAIQSIRRFQRFYTKQIGLLNRKLFDGPFSLTEVRVLYEIHYREKPTAAQIARDLNLDAGYLSRILRQFERNGVLKKTQGTIDTRQNYLSLTTQGKESLAALEARQNKEIQSQLKGLSSLKQSQLLKAMNSIEELLCPPSEPKAAYLLRPHRPGDMGWIVHRHGLLYREEYGYDERFEGMVSKIAAEFLENYDSSCEQCWIAEKEGEIVGSIALMKKTETEAALRLLLVEPAVRGLGIGRRLIAECVRFAKYAGYSKISLQTHSELTTARKLYEKMGFQIVEQAPYQGWGREALIAETWELPLTES